MKEVTFLIILLLCNSIWAQTEEELERCDIYMESYQFKECHDCYDSLIRIHGETERTLRGRGFSSLENGDLTAGKNDYRKALVYNDTCGNCYNHMARALAIEDSLDEALSYIEKAIVLNSEQAENYINRAKINQQRNKRYGITTDYNKAISLSPTSEYYAVRADYYFSVNQISQASLDYDEAVELKPDDAYVRSKRGMFYSQIGEFELAEEDFLFALTVDSLNPEYLSGYAIALQETGRREQALKYYDKAIEIDSRSFSLYFNRGLIQYGLENMEEACQNYRTAMSRTTPNDPPEAIAKIQSYITELCDTAQLSHYYQHGIANYNLLNFPEAIEYYNRGLVLFPKSKMLYSFRGNAYLKLKEYNKAEEDYVKCLSMEGNVLSEITANAKMDNEGAQTYMNFFEADILLALAKIRFVKRDYASSQSTIDRVNKLLDNQVSNQELLSFKVRADYMQVLIYGVTGSFEKARQAANQMINQYHGGESHLLLACIYFFQDTEESVEFFQLLNNDDWKLTSLNWKSLSQKRKKKAKESLITSLEQIEKSIYLDPELGQAYFLRGIIKHVIDQPGACDDLILAEKYGVENARLSSEVDCK